jgi:hypothetical protein
MISVRNLGGDPPRFAVIDGMHRVTSLQLLASQKWLGINYDEVSLEPFVSTDSTHTCTWSTLPPLRRYGQSSTSKRHRHGLCSP